MTIGCILIGLAVLDDAEYKDELAKTFDQISFCLIYLTSFEMISILFLL